jgi:hypothetical protein
VDELKPLICQCCGGKIDRKTMKCPYCDTQYEKKFEGTPVSFTVERPGVHHIRAMARLDEEAVLRNPEIATKWAMDKLRNGIADGLLEYMRIDTEKDPLRFCRIIRADVRVLDPTFSDY